MQLYLFECIYLCCVVFFFQAEDGIRDLVRSRGLGDVYKRQTWAAAAIVGQFVTLPGWGEFGDRFGNKALLAFTAVSYTHLTLPTSDLV